jgi:DNA-binding NarL/FixJ family response regulator
VPAWAKTVITRSEGPSFDPRTLEGLVDYEIIQTTRNRATRPTFSNAFEAVLSGQLDIIPRAVRDRVVKQARRHVRREKFQRLLPAQREGPTRDEGSGAATWDDEVPSTAAGPEETIVLADALTRLAATPGLDVIVAGLVRGDSQRDIAARLRVTARTVRNRIRRMKAPR